MLIPRDRLPWSEIAALVSAGVAVSTWSLAGRAVTLEGALTLGLALTAALAPRRAEASRAPVATEAALIVGALGAAAIATTVAGAHPPTHTLRVAKALLLGEVLGLTTAMAAALPLRLDTLRRAIAPGLLVGGLATLALWPGGRRDWGVGAWGAFVAALLSALYHAHAVGRPLMPIERARLIAPGLGAASLAAALLIRAMWGPTVSPLVLASGVTLQVVGLTLGTGAIGLDRAARLARRSAAAAAGMLVGASLALAVPWLPVLGVVAGLAVTVLVWPVLDRRLRPDHGRLLDACAEIERALPGVRDHADLAAAVLDPLRVAARNLRAPAAIWLIDRREVLRVDVSGGASRDALSLDAARPILAWLRARPGAVFTDTLRPYLVRRAELRALVGALDEHGALGAVPLSDDGELSGVLLIPRGARVVVPTYEEQVRVEALARSIEGVTAMLAALDRARRRADDADLAAAEAERARALATQDRDRLLAVTEGVRRLRALGALDEAWFAYAASSRGARDAAMRVPSHGPVALVAEASSGAVALARQIHDASPRAKGPFVVLDAGRTRAEDVLAMLVGDARGAPERAGWLEHADGGTLVIEDLPALGHDAQVALVDALRTGTARRLGAESAYAVDARVIATLRASPDTYDLPRGLLEMLKPRALRVPPLRERGDDLESLALFAIDRACRVHGRAPVGLAPDALLALRAHGWSGNLDELLAVIDHALLRARGPRITLDALPPHIRGLLAPPTGDDDDDEERPWRGDA